MSGPAVRVRLILASASERRIALLREHGYEFQIDPADIDEEDHPSNLSPGDLAEFLARAKALTVAARHPPAAIVLAADTVVAVGDSIFNKPTDEADARRMLRLLSGSTHAVVTGVAVVRGQGSVITTDQVCSQVRMREMTDDEIHRYVATGNWRGKAGGYGIQDPDPFVTRIEGSLSNIVGLPMERTTELLAKFGVAPTGA